MAKALVIVFINKMGLVNYNKIYICCAYNDVKAKKSPIFKSGVPA